MRNSVVSISLVFVILCCSFIVRPVAAEDTPQQGVTMTVYDGSPLGLVPWETTPDLPVCYSAVVPNIDFGWGGAPAAEGCPADFFLVNFNGWLTVPESGQWEFLNWSDDGWRMTLDGVLTIDDWNFHGCGGHWSGPNEGYSQLVAGQSYALDIWMFEWGGGACARLWYGAPTLGYGTVPTEWLTTTALPTPEPSPSIEPSPSVEPSPEPSPSVEPSVEPSPTPEPSPSEEPSIEPSPLPSPTPQPTPTPTETPAPTPAPTPKPTATSEPSPSESVEPSPTPSSEPTPVDSPSPEPSDAPIVIDPGAAAEAVAEAVGAAVEAVGEAIDAAVTKIVNLGKDLSPEEKKAAQPVAVAVIISQVASAAVAAATSKSGAQKK